MRQQNFQNQQGFTLVEMLIVIALLALLIGMALPSFAKMRRIARVNTAANRLYTSLVKARNLALRKQRPIIVKVFISATNLQFLACLDSDYATANKAGASSVTFDCGGGDAAVSQSESPFFGTLTINKTTSVDNNVSLGFPAADATSTYSARPSNMALAGVVWFGFDSSGKLIPDGRTPYTTNVTDFARYPAGSAINTGGPEFYFAEFNAGSNTRAKTHVYRKVELLMQGSVRVQQWQPAGSGGTWTGMR